MLPYRLFHRGSLAPVLLGFVCVLTSAAQQPVSFDRDIKPIFENRCLKCHGASMQAAKLDPIEAIRYE